MANESFKEDQSAELQTLRNVKQFLTQKLKMNEELLKSLQKDIIILNNDLQKEKRQNLNITDQFEQMTNEREEHKDNVKELNMQYDSIVSQITLSEPNKLTLFS